MAEPLLALDDLAVHFTVGSVLAGGVKILKAVDGVTLDVRLGECLSLVGESGCGKSSLALAIMGLLPPTRGRLALEGRDIGTIDRMATARTVQMVFQDPYASLNPRQTVRRTLADPLRIHGVTDKAEIEGRVADIMARVGLRPEQADRYPHEFSGGQRRRIGIARALILRPRLVICDEPVSALDVSIRAHPRCPMKEDICVREVPRLGAVAPGACRGLPFPRPAPYIGTMNSTDIDRIADWVIRRGLEGVDETSLLREFCEKCAATGLPVSRGLAFIDTLHPVYEGRLFRWRDDGAEEEATRDYGRSDQGANAESWQRSPFFHLLQTGGEELRRRIAFGDPADYSIVQEMKDIGHTDYILFVHRFTRDGSIGEMDCVCSSWSTRHPAGFSDANVAALRRLVPALALALKSGTLARIAATLVEVYLGRDAGRRVLEGRIQRGVADRISSVLWFSDLRSFTTITDSAAPGQIIPLLNDYADAVITSVQQAGGDVLKLIGDGTLAIFRADNPAKACALALEAEAEMRRRVRELNERRGGEGLPTTLVYVGLHIGEVLFGNIGSVDRLDFTVVGPAVNETSRIASMCRSVDRPVLISSAFAEALPAAKRSTLVSVGRFALRGVGRAQDLFTLDPALV